VGFVVSGNVDTVTGICGIKNVQQTANEISDVKAWHEANGSKVLAVLYVGDESWFEYFVKEFASTGSNYSQGNLFHKNLTSDR
jgi:hypothetical protein